MENRAHALAAGLFALIFGAALLGALWWFSNEHEPMRDLVLVARGDINGLGPQARVRYRGLAVGTVSAVRIDPRAPHDILVHVRVAEDLPLTRGTRATLGTMGVTGLAYVQLDDRGDDPTPLAGTADTPPRIPLEPGLLDRIAERALAAVDRFDMIGTQVARMFDTENVARLRATLQRLESAAEGMDRSFADVPETLRALRAVLSPANLASLQATLGNLEQASAEATPAVAELRGLLARIEHMTVRLDEAATATSSGLIDGTLPQLNELLRELTTTSRRVGRLVEEVESTPQVLLTGRAAREPGPGEPGFGALAQ